MPRYKYKAYAAGGGLESGVISAASRAGALDALAEGGRLPVEIGEADAGARLPWWQREIGASRIPTGKLALFTRELAGLSKAELPTDEALRIVRLQPMIPSRLRAISADLLGRLREGESLSGALSGQGSAFPNYYCRLVEAAEASGNLAGVLDSLAVFLERDAETRAKVKASLLYPAVLIAVALGALLVITSALLPAVMPIFEDAGASPPVAIRWLAAAQAFLARQWLTVLVMAAVALGAILLLLGRETVRVAIDRALLRLPVAGRLIAERQSARLSRTLAMLVRGGVPLPDAIRISGSVLSNRAFASAVREAGNDVTEGGGLARSLAGAGIFPELFLRLATIGEETGQLEAMHDRIATIFEGTVERQVSTLTSLITPLLTVVIGLLVGGLILSVMDAILSINALAVQ